jgi:hypothetical protein
MCFDDIKSILSAMIDDGSCAQYGVRLLGSGKLFSNEIEGGWYGPSTPLSYLAYRPDRSGD